MTTSPSATTTPSPRQAASLPQAARTMHAQQSAHCNDVDEQAALLNGWNQQYEQLSCGAFKGSVSTMQIGPIQLIHEFTNQALHQTGALSAGAIAIGLPNDLPGTAMFCGQTCHDKQALIFSGDAPFEFVSPGTTRMLDVVIQEQDLQHYVTHDEMQALHTGLQKPHPLAISPLAREQFLGVCADVQQWLAPSVESAPEQTPNSNAPLQSHSPLYAQQHQAMERDMGQAVATLLLDGVLANMPDDSISYQRRAEIVRQTRERVMSSPAEETVTVEQLCQELGISRRALQYSFTQVLGISPLAYLRAMRLNGARRAIKHSTSVADAATAWGFWHFGRFSQDYKALFGELPSQTFKRFH
ncbi:helix-turn-helix domain-containing protein [Lampropedia puyangensis]|uniref:Helix-turn-helix domain-containing protein n=1 Tax=Lampropedia puyangensis TaxID=1330072 RepID=A0A4S8FEN2_9BURK|nr:helix-turn-helix domain-containing protein [Lampropedia puyangensis]THU05124.1 helix-turn-helix domain-containing protein [Lampropedia puyangensis]